MHRKSEEKKVKWIEIFHCSFAIRRMQAYVFLN